MKLKYLGNCLLIFTLAILFLVPSFYPTNAQNAESCQCAQGQTLIGNILTEEACRVGCSRIYGGTWVVDTSRCTCGEGEQRDGVNEQSCPRDGCTDLTPGTWGVVAATAPAAQPPPVQQLENPLGAGADIPEIIARVIKAVLGLVGSIGLLMFIYGGFLWLTAGGSDERVKKGREVLVWATLGLVVIFSAYAILNFVIGALTRSAG